jgi:hypothetical protein
VSVVSSAAALIIETTPMEPTTAAVRLAANHPRREIDTCPSSFIGGSEAVGEGTSGTV